MSKLLDSIKNRIYYSVASVKNRYPCKIINVKLPTNLGEPAKVIYRAVTKFNIIESSPKNIIDDPVLIEKFHTTEGVQLGFLSAGEILFKEGITLEEARACYKKIVHKMFEVDSDNKDDENAK